MFDLNLGLSVWTTLVFLSLLAILWKFAWGPILGAVQAREDGIQETLDEAANERGEAAKLLAEHREQMADARRQAQQMIAEGKEAGERVRQDIEEKARAEGDAMIERAVESSERAQEAAHEERRKEAAAKGQYFSDFPPRIRWSPGNAEAASVSFATVLPLKAVLLLRLGPHNLADRLWRQWHIAEERFRHADLDAG